MTEAEMKSSMSMSLIITNKLNSSALFGAVTDVLIQADFVKQLQN